MKEMNCPFCNAELEVDEIYDGMIDREHHEEEWYGHCPKCKKRFRWTHIFTYESTKDFEEIPKDE